MLATDKRNREIHAYLAKQKQKHLPSNRVGKKNLHKQFTSENDQVCAPKQVKWDEWLLVGSYT